MALLDIDELKADALGQPGRLDVAVRQPAQLIVGQQRVTRIDRAAGGLVDHGPRVEDRVVKGQQRPAIAVTARVSQLQPDHQILVGAEGFSVGGPAGPEHGLKVRGGLVVEEQLAGVGPALLHHGGRLAPDQLGAPGPKAAITADGQLIGPAIKGAVAALHGLDAQGVAGPQRADGDGPEQRTEVLAETQTEAELLTLGFEVSEGAEFEEACQRKPRGSAGWASGERLSTLLSW